MNKKLAGLMVAGVAVFALSGCGSSGGNDVVIVDPGPPSNLTTLLIVDGFNDGVDGIYYECDSYTGITGDGPVAGEFSFIPGDDCDFYLDDSVVVGNDLFLTDVTKIGVNDKYYICNSLIDGYTGDTGFPGEFIYDYGFNDVCTFEL